MIRIYAAIAGAAALALMWGSWLWQHDSKIAARTETKIVQRSEAQGKQNAAKSQKAYDAARRPGAVDRLRKDAAACPDCGK